MYMLRQKGLHWAITWFMGDCFGRVVYRVDGSSVFRVVAEDVCVCVYSIFVRQKVNLENSLSA
jgi:hypothetical protein